MVLERLRILGRTDEMQDVSRLPRDGEPATFPELLEIARRQWGDKVAFQEKHQRQWQRHSHNDTYRRAYDLAAGFAALGVEPGDRVAIILENSYDWVCAYYGIVLCGGVGVPIYYDLKPSEITEMVRHADPKMAVVSGKALPKIESAVAHLATLIVVGEDRRARDAAPNGLSRAGQPATMTLDDVIARGTAESRARVVAHVPQPDDLASIVFTSGTSGGQKGVMLTHRNFMANLAQVRRSIPFGEGDRLVMVLPLHHAFPFTVTVAVAPAVGGEVTFENDLRRIRDRMAEVKPTLFLGVPALFEVMYRNILVGIEAQGRLENFQKGLRIVEATKQRTGINIGRIVFRELHKRLGGSLRFMVSGGAALNPQVARDFAALGVCIIQGWGLSEAAPVLSVQRWNPRRFYMSNYYEEHVGSIGQPLEGVEIGLIDVPEKELYVHLHGEGELVASGDNITPGYWRSDEATDDMKVGEWLRTGDIGRIDEDGNIWITGRSKFVIVLDSGEKVYPDEVEEKLELSPVVQDIVVQGRKLRGKTQIVAVVYPNREGVLTALGDAPLTADAVREIVAEGIRAQERDVASFKRILEFMLTDEPLPRTPIRKVMRGHIRDSYGFDVERWAQTWGDLQEALATPPSEGEGEAEELATA
jgi:long-chain acyl-CoA synthetase